MASTKAGNSSLLPCSNRSSWPARKMVAPFILLHLELRDQRKVVGHPPPDPAAGNMHAHRLEPAGIHVIQLSQRKSRWIGQLTLTEEVFEASRVHRRAQLAAPVIEVTRHQHR